MSQITCQDIDKTEGDREDEEEEELSSDSEVLTDEPTSE